MSYPKLNSVKRQIIKDLGADATPSEIIAEYEARKASFNSTIDKEDAKRRYKEDVYNEMLEVFGTTSTEIIQANHEENKLRVAKPSLFTSDQIEEQGIIDAAQAEIDKAESYLVFRNNRYKQYQAELESN